MMIDRILTHMGRGLAGMQPQVCAHRHPGPVVAGWMTQPAGNVVTLCQTHLDMWFDNADDDPALEPAAWWRLGETA